MFLPDCQCCCCPTQRRTEGSGWSCRRKPCTRSRRSCAPCGHTWRRRWGLKGRSIKGKQTCCSRCWRAEARCPRYSWMRTLSRRRPGGGFSHNQHSFVGKLEPGNTGDNRWPPWRGSRTRSASPWWRTSGSRRRQQWPPSAPPGSSKTDPCPRTLGGILSVRSELQPILKSTFPPFTGLTVLATVSAANSGQGGAASGDVELVIHARVVRRLGSRQQKVLHVESVNQNGEGGGDLGGIYSTFLVVLRPFFSSYGSCKGVPLCTETLCVGVKGELATLQSSRGRQLFVGSAQLTVQACVGPTDGREGGPAGDDELVEVALVVGGLRLGQHHVVYV